MLVPGLLLLSAVTSLHDAVYNDDVAAAERLIRDGADAKAANRYGVPALLLACTNSNPRMMDLLLKGGADPNSAGPGGETALMSCARSGNVDGLKALLARGADVHGRESRRGQTA
ncbi:MAG TPA: ankyrin repeat domain-containing protein, partial [Bryobacteraceae bacterium]|nr:ankyrin repeat domain-containing protein [Bryobacteraceae bacterium]